MNDKVKLKREVADAIEHFRSLGHENSSIVYMFASGMNYDNMTAKTLSDYASDNFDNFLRALVNGYEVDQAPEEKLRDWYTEHWDNQKTFSVNRELSKTISTTIYKTLDLLNIKIPGVNAE